MPKRKPDTPPPPTRGRRRIDPATRQAVADYLRDNPEAKRNETAEKFGVSPGTVTNISREVGRSFDRAATETATHARKVDVEKRTVELAERLIEEAHKLVDTIDAPYLVYNFGGKDNTYNAKKLRTPPVEVKRAIVTVAAIAIDKALKVRKETTSGAAPSSAFEAFMRMLGGDDTGDMSSETSLSSAEAVD